MSESMDEYFEIVKGAPAPFATPQKTDEPGILKSVSDTVSNIPQAAYRFVDIWNRTEADKGDQLARALRAGFSEEYYQELQQQRVNASRLAELQLQDMENRVQQNAFSLEQKKRLAPIVEKDAELSLQNKQLSLEQKKQLMPEQLKEQRAVTQMRLLQLQQAQYKAWDDEAVKKVKLIDDQMKQRFGYSLMNDAGRAVYDNSIARKAFDDVSIIMSAIKTNPEQAKYYAEKTGWKYSLNGDNIDTLTSPDGKMVFTANQQGMQTLLGNIQKTLMDDITAARIKGTDAQDFATGSAKVLLSDPFFKSVYGTEGNVLRAYRNHVDQKIIDPKTKQMKDVFTPSQKTTHALAVCLNSAFQDNFFSDAEKGAITPLLVPVLKQKGVEVKWGQGVDDTFVTIRSDGGINTMPIREFAHVLAQRDVISQTWSKHVMSVAQKMKSNQSGGENGEVEKPVSKEDSIRIFNTYGNDAWRKMTPEMKSSIIAAENMVAHLAEKNGIAERKNGKFIYKENLTQDDINKMRAIEQNAFEYYKVGDLADKAFWAKMEDIKTPKPQKTVRLTEAESKRLEQVAFNEREKELDDKFGQSMMNK